MQKKVDVAIIGAGSAGLSALRQVKEVTDNYVIINRNSLGTKCARIGCMPSKVLISVAKDYHRRKVFADEGISGAEKLHADIPSILNHIRSLRDHFTNGMIKATKQLAGEHLITGCAKIIAPDLIEVGNIKIKTDKIIIASGSRPKIPNEWKKFGERILTSDNIFEQKDLPRRIAVVGLGPIGLELGQALSRLGLEIVGFDLKKSIAATTDPKISTEVVQIFKQEFPIYLGAALSLEYKNGIFLVKHPDIELPVDAILVAIGVEPDIQGLGLENLGLELNKRGIPPFDENTTRIAELPVFIAGDANGYRPILHEALDEGFIAARNSCSQDINCFCRRTPIYLVFTDPQIATVGISYEQSKNNKVSFIVGKTDFSQQSRAVLELHNQGLLHIYVDKDSAEILGAEFVCPDAEHLAHQLAIAIQHHLTIFDMLQIPFYHPTIEEALRTALRDAAKQLPDKIGLQELSLCDICPEAPLR
jgi:dihydrolipoamide dehydrogenase